MIAPLRREDARSRRVDQQMTPMIDIVFQLLAFFVMTFHVVAPEGDFDVAMPRVPPDFVAEPPPNLPIRVAMRAGDEGELAGIVVNPGRGDERALGADVESLGAWMARAHARLAAPSPLAVEPEVELVCDYRLRYGATMAALSSISGSIDPASGRTTPLFEKVRFARPKANPGK